MTTAATEAHPVPTADWVTIPDLYRNPYPIYQKLREESPVHWVPAVNRYMVSATTPATPSNRTPEPSPPTRTAR